MGPNKCGTFVSTEGKDWKSMSDISVLYVSYVTLWPGMGNVVHTHDYWHWSTTLSGVTETLTGERSSGKPSITCARPNVPHAGIVCREEHKGVNIMFFVHDRKLEKQLENFDPRTVRPEGTFTPVLTNILDQIDRLKPSQEFMDAAISYYLRLVLENAQTYQALEPGPETLADRCLNFIEQNYMKQLRLEDIADHIGRTKSYTSYLVSNTTGQTVVEHLNAVRIKNACTLLAYSDTPIDHVSEVCGFTNVKNFCRVFKNIVGTTPTRYRTSHGTEDMCYYGDMKDLDAPYNCLTYTYVPSARKCIYWKTPLEYISQAVKKSELD